MKIHKEYYYETLYDLLTISFTYNFKPEYGKTFSKDYNGNNSEDLYIINKISNDAYTDDWGISELEIMDIKDKDLIIVSLLSSNLQVEKFNEKNNGNQYIWVGKSNFDYAILVVENNSVNGIATAGNNKYKIIQLNNGSHLIQKLNKDFEHFECYTQNRISVDNSTNLRV